MSHIFVSYAREDAAVVERLAAALTERGRATWVDEREIEGGDRWRTSLEEAIDAADAALFVLSRHWTASGPCRQELEHAVAVNKRLVPVVIEDVPRAQLADALGEVPEALAELDWIFLAPGDDFAVGVDEIVRAVDLDLDLLRLHSAVLTRARSWEAAGRRPSPLLRGDELRRAEAWRDRAATGKRPAPTELQSAFILESRRRANDRTRRIVIGALGVATVAVALAVVALIERAHAVTQSHISHSRELAANASASLASDPERSISLAAQAVRVSATPQAIHVLAAALDASRLRLDLRQPAPIETVAFSPNGRELATGDSTGVVRVWRLTRPAVLWRANVGRVPQSLAFSPDGKRLVVARSTPGISTTAGCEAEVRNAANGKRERVLGTGHGSCQLWVGFLGTSGRVAVAVANGSGAEVITCDAASGRAIASFGGLPELSQVSFAADGRTLSAIGLQDKDVYVLRMPGGGQLAKFQSPVAIFDPISTAPGPSQPTAQGTTLADEKVMVGGEYETEIYDVRNKTHLYLPLAAAAAAVSFAPDGRLVVAATQTGTDVWSAVSGRLVETLPDATSQEVQASAFSASGLLATGSADGSVRVWAPDPDLPSHAQPGGYDGLDHGGDAPGARLAAIGDASATVFVTDQAGRVRARLRLGGAPPFAVGAGGALAYARAGRLDVIHLPSTHIVRSWALGRGSTITPDIAVSGDGRVAATMLSTAATRALLSVHTPTGTRSTSIPVSDFGAGASIGLSPDGRLIVLAGLAGSRSVRVLRTRDLSSAFTAQGTAAQFSSSGAALAVERPDQSIAVLATHRFRTMNVLVGEQYPGASLGFSPDGRLLAAVDEDDVLRVWDAADGAALGTTYFADGEVYPGRTLAPQAVLVGGGRALIGSDQTAALDTFEVCDQCLDAQALLSQAARRLHAIRPVRAR